MVTAKDITTSASDTVACPRVHNNRGPLRCIKSESINLQKDPAPLEVEHALHDLGGVEHAARITAANL